jgi:hypothetical protein
VERERNECVINAQREEKREGGGSTTLVHLPTTFTPAVSLLSIPVDPAIIAAASAAAAAAAASVSVILATPAMTVAAVAAQLPTGIDSFFISSDSDSNLAIAGAVGARSKSGHTHWTNSKR